ncbi:MAG: hypothetical protein QOH57_2266 [Mycobacterium sp.]|nr:hypothetical protein [Mycobacterium sp.]
MRSNRPEESLQRALTEPLTAGSASEPVVVGVDGTRAALNAVKWAAPEAANRDVPLRLVHVVSPAPRRRGGTSGTGFETGHVAELLQQAKYCAEDFDKHVRVESVVKCGRPETVLLEQSRHAGMICIGSPTYQSPVDGSLGSIASALAEHSCCPVAVIRTDDYDSLRTECGVISVVLNDEPDNDAVVHLAMHEGRLRHATVRQVDRRVNSWNRRYADVPVEMVAAGAGGRYANRPSRDDGPQLAVVGRSDAAKISHLGTPNCHPILGYPDCSVLLVRS